MRRALILCALLWWPEAARAHAAGGFGEWNLDPWAAVPMVAGASLYATGLARLWSAASPGRGMTGAQAACFSLGFAVLAAALFSPLDHHAESVFSAHMVQHQLIMLIAAPLVAFGRPGAAFPWALPRTARPVLAGGPGVCAIRSGWRAATHPAGAWMAFFLALWLWHVPALYQASVENLTVHRIQHATFFLAALLFWIAVLDRPRQADAHGLALVAAFTTAIHACALGALLTVSTRLWYPIYAARTGPLRAHPDRGPAARRPRHVGAERRRLRSRGPLRRRALARGRGAPRRFPRARRPDHVGSVMSLRGALLLLPLLTAACDGEEGRPLPDGIPALGAEAIERHGCGTCHQIPGIPGAAGATGPPLTAMNRQAYVAGVVPNEPDWLIAFIMNPQAVDPRSAMPNLAISAEEARHIAAYLYAAGLE